MLKTKTECALCRRSLQLAEVSKNIPDFCPSCYMAKIHPAVELIIRQTEAGQRIPEHVEIVKRVMAELDTCCQ